MMNVSEFQQYKINANEKTKQIIKQKPNQLFGQALTYIVKQDFPSIIKKIKYTNINVYDNDENNLKQFWNFVKKNLFVKDNI